jgi:hypothetical protein
MGAADTQQSLLAASNNYSVISGLSFGETEESIGRINERLTEVASTLPGVTDQYRKIGTNLIGDILPAMEGLDGTIDVKGTEDSVVNLATSFGLLGSKMQEADVSKAAGGLIGGKKSLSELNDLLFFEENTSFLPEIEKELKKRNVEQLGDLDARARLDVVETVAAKFASPEYIAEINKTTGALLEGFASSLFDQTEGVFGMSRDLIADRDGAQTVFMQVTDTLDLLIGGGGIFAGDGPLVGLMNALGIEAKDPMLMIYRGVEWFNIQLEAVVELTDDLTEKVKGGLSIGKSIGGFLDKLSGDTLGAKFGSLIGDLLERGLDTGRKFFESVDWNKIGNEGGEFLGSAIGTIIREFPYGKLLGYAASAFINVADFVLSTGIGILRSLAVEIWDWVKEGVTGALTGIGKGVWNAPGNIVQGIRNRDESKMQGSVSAGRGRDIAIAPSAALTSASRRNVRRSGRAEGQGIGDMDIMSAVAMERAAVPSADIVIANSTEAIIPQGSALVRPQTGGGRSGGGINQTINFSPTLVLPQGSPREMAEQVLAVLNNLVAENMESQLV